MTNGEPECTPGSEPDDASTDSADSTNDHHVIAHVITTFADHINALRSTIRATMFLVQAAWQSSAEQFDEYIEEIASDIEKDDDRIVRAHVPSAHVQRVQQLGRKRKQAGDALLLVPRSFTVALVSEFDAFLGRLMNTFYELEPELLGNSKRSLTVGDLMEFASLEAARAFLAEKEVEALLRKSHADQFKSLESRFDVKLREGLKTWPQFIELTERRNLFVHSDGIVSQQYLDVCRHHNISTTAIVGQTLGVTPKYFDAACVCVYSIGVKLGQVLWRKLFKADLEDADKSLLELSFHLLEEGKFFLAKDLLEFACKTLPRTHSDVYRRMFVVNLAQAHKWLGDDEECDRILAAEDWSATGREFQLCVRVLQEDFDRACSLMRELGKKGRIDEASYENWPVFREFRNRDDFASTFKDVFEKEFGHLERRWREEAQEKRRRMIATWEDQEAENVDDAADEDSAVH